MIPLESSNSNQSIGTSIGADRMSSPPPCQADRKNTRARATRCTSPSPSCPRASAAPGALRRLARYGSGVGGVAVEPQADSALAGAAASGVLISGNARRGKRAGGGSLASRCLARSSAAEPPATLPARPSRALSANRLSIFQTGSTLARRTRAAFLLIWDFGISSFIVGRER